MIPWRYHLVSIMAIFLALGLGVVVGTTVINPGLVKNLNSQTDELTQHVRDLQKNLSDLQSQLATMDAFSEQAMPYLVGDELFGRQAVIVTEEGVDARAVAQTRRALDLSAAEVLTTLTVRPTMSGSRRRRSMTSRRCSGCPPPRRRSNCRPRPPGRSLGVSPRIRTAIFPGGPTSSARCSRKGSSPRRRRTSRTRR